MNRLPPELRREYERWLRRVKIVSPTGPLFVDAHDALRAHFLLLDEFTNDDSAEGFGGMGPRSIPLLQSAIDRQHVSFGSSQKWTNIYEYCATTFFGLVKNHAFHDGNKRTALLLALYQLQRASLAVTTGQKEVERLAIRTAAGDLSKYNRYGQFRKFNQADRNVRFIADYLRRNTRPVDRRFYVVTFRQLDRLLREHDCWLESPKNNYIDVMQRRRVRRFFRRKEEIIRVLRTGFPGWKREVSRSDIKKIRSATGLTAKNGVDSQVFFKGLEPMESLIAQYHRPLKRLADR